MSLVLGRGAVLEAAREPWLGHFWTGPQLPLASGAGEPPHRLTGSDPGLVLLPGSQAPMFFLRVPGL